MFLSLKNLQPTNHLIPVGDYPAVVDIAELKTAKNPLNKYLNIKFRLLENGQYVYMMMNIINDNPVAQSIGLEQLQKLLSYNGKSMEFESSDDLLMAIADCHVLLTINHREYNGQQQVNVKKISKLDSVEKYVKKMDLMDIPF
jgi:hypothetical protein